MSCARSWVLATLAALVLPGAASAAPRTAVLQLGGLWPFGAKPAPAKPVPAQTPDPAKPAVASAPATTPAPATKPPFHVTGFRSARFGMGQDQVLAAIAADFKLGADKVQVSANALERTTLLTVTVDGLDPGPGKALVTYVLGAASHKLIRVAVAWITPGQPTAAERLALVNDGVLLVNYFAAENWTGGAARQGVPLGPNALAMFSARDADGSTVEVDVQGVAYTQQVGGKPVASPEPKGHAALSLIYTQDAAHPDIYRVPQGAF